MIAQILSIKYRPLSQFAVEVLLDNTKVVAGMADPSYIATFVYPGDVPPDMTPLEYKQWIKEQIIRQTGQEQQLRAGVVSLQSLVGVTW